MSREHRILVVTQDQQTVGRYIRVGLEMMPSVRIVSVSGDVSADDGSELSVPPGYVGCLLRGTHEDLKKFFGSRAWAWPELVQGASPNLSVYGE